MATAVPTSTELRVVRGDITTLEVDAFVHDTSGEPKLDSGYGGAIQMRGGIAVQKELEAAGPVPKGSAVATGAGLLKAAHIIHVNGPKFREPDEEGILRATVRAALALAEERGAETVALPPIGTGLYQVPLDLCARVLAEEARLHLANGSRLRQVILVAADLREEGPLRAQLEGGA